MTSDTSGTLGSVIFDAATFDDPAQYPVGIPYVLVNGRIAVDNEICTGSLFGQALRRS